MVRIDWMILFAWIFVLLYAVYCILILEKNIIIFVGQHKNDNANY